MNNSLIDNCNAVVAPEARLFFVGGFLFGPLDEKNFVACAAKFRKKIACRNLFLVYGNHDRRGRKSAEFRSLFSFVGDYLEVIACGDPKLKDRNHPSEASVILNHYPIEYPYWNRIKDGAIHLHGHTHKGPEGPFREQKKLDVGVDSKAKYLSKNQGSLPLGATWGPWSFNEIQVLLNG